MRLIDADANIETMKKCAENPEDKYALLCYRYAQRVLEEAPTVEPASPWHRADEPPKKTGKYAVCWTYQEKPYWDWLIFLDGNWELQAGLPLPDYWMPIEPPKEDV